MTCHSIFFIFFCSLSLSILAQDFDALEYRNVGPYRGGRVTTVAGIASQPGTFYQGATGGGVWKTEDFGTSWHNVSDGYFDTPSIGAIAVAQNDPNIVYVGTGSDGLRSNVIAGKGMYKSIDGGQTWSHIGLKEVGQIGGVRIHPLNHNVVYVAAIGQAFQRNAQRGIFKTTDGGKSWEKVLYASDQTGFSDIEMLPSNPDILFAAAWKAERKPWTIISGGKVSEGGMYKSHDAGKTWQKVTEGFPSDLIGKMDIQPCAADSRIVYALAEAPKGQGGLYESIDQGESFEQVSDHKGIRSRPFYYTNIRVDPTNCEVVYAMATGYYKSTNGGKNWSKLTPPHGDNHDMWINPKNPDLFIQANDGGANVTHNGGKTWSTQFNQPTAEIYQVEVDDQYPYWLYGGQQDNYTTVSVPSQAPYGIQYPGVGYIVNTGGCETGPAVPKPGNSDIVYSNCKGRFGVFDKRTGIEKVYYVGASNMYGHNPKDLKFRFQRVSPIHVSPHDPNTVYHCSQYVHKTIDEGKTWEIISPDLTAFESDKQVISGSPITRDITGEEFYSTIYAIRESTVKPGVIWVGANDGPIHVTEDGGENWKNVTPKGLLKGGRVDAVEPSPHNAAKAYACILRYQLGDWKPYIYRTNDYGKNWTLLTNGRNGIPSDYPVRVVREDPVREGLLFAGTEYGMYISMDDGTSWSTFQQNLPLTPITDIKIQRGDLAMSTMGRGFWVLENITSLRQTDHANLSEHKVFRPKSTYRYRYPTGARNSTMPKYPRPGVIIDYFLSDDVNDITIQILNQEGDVINTYINSKGEKLESETKRDMSTNEIEYIEDNSLTGDQGLNRFRWDMTMTGAWHSDTKKRYKRGPIVLPGEYAIKMKIGDEVYTSDFEILQDPRTLEQVTMDDLKKQKDIQIKVRDLLTEVRESVNDQEKEVKKLKDATDLTDEDKIHLERIEMNLKMLKTKDGIYEKPMLVDQVSYLYNMLDDADQTPGQDVLDRYEELMEEWSALME